MKLEGKRWSNTARISVFNKRTVIAVAFYDRYDEPFWVACVRCCRLLLSLPHNFCSLLLFLLYLPLAHWYFYCTHEKFRQENASKSWLTRRNSWVLRQRQAMYHLWWTDAAFYLFKTLLVDCFAFAVFTVVVTRYLALSLFYLH